MSLDLLLTRLRKLRVIATVPSYRRALRHGVAASTEHHRDPLPGDIATVVDVGANRGQFALVARERWPRARVICFEPLPAAREALERVVGGAAEVRIVGAAAGARTGRATVHVSRAEDSSSLLPITARQTEAFPGTDEVATVAVPVVSLDDELGTALNRPALLKIDVQGFELEVLRGGERVLGHIDFVLVECSFAEFYAGQARADQVIRFLHEHGFSLTGANAPSLDRNGGILQLDLLFARHTL